MALFKDKNRRLGVAHQTRKYDLPLEKGQGGRFLKILMGLMTLLAMFAFVASFALSAMTERWSSGLSNKATIEIPAAMLITGLIGFTTVIAAAGAVQARMAMYSDELELLHLMGAADSYISRQLQRYTFFSCLQGAAIGAIAGFAILLLTSFVFKEQEISLLPDFDISPLQLVILCFLPIFIAILGMITARHTVLRTLVKMP